MLCDTYLYDERVSGKGLTLLCEAVCIISTGAAVGTDKNAKIERITENCVSTGEITNFPYISDSVVRTNTEAPMVKVTGNCDSVRIEITFKTGTRGRFIVNKRKSGQGHSLYVYVSSELTGGRYRYVYFRNLYGCHELFRSFILTQLKKFVSTWKSRGDAQRWCESNLDSLKQRVETGWLQQLKRLPRKRSRSTQYGNTLMSSARCNSTINIPLHGFLLEGRVPAIRISFLGKFDKRPYLSVSFPGFIFGDNKARHKSMKCRFGHDRQWSCFVGEYVKTAASQ